MIARVPFKGGSLFGGVLEIPRSTQPRAGNKPAFELPRLFVMTLSYLPCTLAVLGFTGFLGPGFRVGLPMYIESLEVRLCTSFASGPNTP